MKISLKFLLIFGILVASLILITFLSLYSISQLKHSVDSIIYEHYPKVQTAGDIKDSVNELSKSVRNYVLADSEEVKNFENERITSAIETAVKDLSTIKEMITDKQGKLVINDLERAGESYMQFQQQVLQLAQEGNESEAASLLVNDGLTYHQALFNALDDLIEISQVEMDTAGAASEKLYEDTFGMMLVIQILIILLGTGVTLWLSRSIVRNLRKVSVVMNHFTQGNADSSTRLQIDSRDEIGLVAASFNQMAVSLQDKHEQEQEWRELKQDQVWLHSNLSILHSSMQDSYTIEELGSKILEEIAPLMGISCGIIYMDEELEEDKPRYKRAATYAISPEEKRKLSDHLGPGEGIIGQVILTGKKVILKDVQTGDMRITTGLSNTKSAHIYIIALHNNKKVEAVMELAVYQELTEIQEELLEQLTDIAGLYIVRLKSQRRIEQLLIESQSQTEELQQYSEELHAQQEELTQTNSELEEQTAALQESEQSLQKQQNLLEETNSDLEEKTKQLISASAYKSEFLANMSHELRTPLNSMLILAKLLSENKDGNLTDKQVEFANTVYSSGNDLLTLINEILDLAKIEAGKTKVKRNSIDIHGVAQFVHRNYATAAQQKGLELHIDIQPGVPDFFRSDPLRLQQILRNLLSNSVKFTESGSIRFSIYTEDEETLCMSISDTGIGIPKVMQETIFNAFVQADGTTIRKFGGTGLGLSISRELAALLSGKITLSSTLGEGSKFTLVLPLLENDEDEDEEPQNQASLFSDKNEEHTEDLDYNFSDKTVLVVDDDIRNVFALSSRLETYGIRVLYGDNGKSGIEMLKQNPQIDLILMDIMMPEMDGYTAIREIRTIPKYVKLPIVTLTAKAMEDDLEKSMEAGASDYITKPVDVDKLLSLLKIWLVAKS
jgi:two-component system chemotaxis sensor kinase CheA